MALPREAARTPTAIGDIRITLIDPDPTGSEPQAAGYEFQLRYSDGSVEMRRGDLTPHLTQQQISSLVAFMAAMRAKAVAEVLP